MDVAALSTALSNVNLANQVSVQVLSMSLDTLEVTGDGMRKMMEMSVNPSVGGNIDVSV